MAATQENMITFLDVAKMNGADKVVGIIDETIRAHPEITLIPARTIVGLNYKTLIRTALPTVAFRKGNQGTPGSKSVYEDRTVGTFLLNPRWTIDKMVADGHEDGAEALLALEADGQLQASMISMASQFYYGANTSLGVTADPLAYPGLMSMYDTTLTYNAGGTTANTGTSVWGVTPGAKNVQWVFGKNGEMKPSDVFLTPVTDANGYTYTAYCQEMGIRPGLQLGSLLGVGRIKNITNDAGCTLNDAKLAAFIALFRVGCKPKMLFMTRRAMGQLQASRTVVLHGDNGAARDADGNYTTVAPEPTSYNGIPIYATDAISDTEALT